MTEATELLARRLVTLELLAQQAEHASLEARAESLWRERDDIRHERSLLLRQIWRYRARGTGPAYAMATS